MLPGPRTPKPPQTRSPTIALDCGVGPVSQSSVRTDRLGGGRVRGGRGGTGAGYGAVATAHIAAAARVAAAAGAARASRLPSSACARHGRDMID